MNFTDFFRKFLNFSIFERETIFFSFFSGNYAQIGKNEFISGKKVADKE